MKDNKIQISEEERAEYLKQLKEWEIFDEQNFIENREELFAWIAVRPISIQEMIYKYPPCNEYTMDNHISAKYIPHSYNEDGTISLLKFNRLYESEAEISPEYIVFGVDPKEITILNDRTYLMQNS